jgi:tetratricopeptide (TPR) repeat protein
MTSWHRKTIPALLMLMIAGQAAAGSRVDEQAILEEARAAYKAALATEERDQRLAAFNQARLQFDRLVTAGVSSADLFADLGNAALQAEDLGQAVLAYRRALLLDPDHPRARLNLQHARSLLPAWVPRPAGGGALDTFFFWHRTWSRAERAALAALAFAAAVLLVAAAVRWRRPLLRNFAVLPALIWLGLLTSLWLESDSATHQAVIITPGGEPALSADDPSARPVFSNPLPDGTEVTVVERREGWANVRLADDSRGAWVRSGSIAAVAGK